MSQRTFSGPTTTAHVDVTSTSAITTLADLYSSTTGNKSQEEGRNKGKENQKIQEEQKGNVEGKSWRHRSRLGLNISLERNAHGELRKILTGGENIFSSMKRFSEYPAMRKIHR